jgi:hypothetical protein
MASGVRARVIDGGQQLAQRLVKLAYTIQVVAAALDLDGGLVRTQRPSISRSMTLRETSVGMVWKPLPPPTLIVGWSGLTSSWTIPPSSTRLPRAHPGGASSSLDGRGNRDASTSVPAEARTSAMAPRDRSKSKSAGLGQIDVSGLGGRVQRLDGLLQQAHAIRQTVECIAWTRFRCLIKGRTGIAAGSARGGRCRHGWNLRCSGRRAPASAWLRRSGPPVCRAISPG